MVKKRIEKKKKNIVREYTEAIGVALIIALILRIFVISAYRIPTGSMKDTLLIGDFLLVTKFMYGVRTPDRIPVVDIPIPFIRLPAFKLPKRGDIIVFKYPLNTKLDYIKRCVALPGQTVEVRQGELFIDGVPEGKSEFVQKKYDAEEGHYINYYQITMTNGKKYTIRKYEMKDSQLDNFGPVTVPKDHYFMMGDNRDNSADSRVWGFLPRNNIVGEALIIYWSWDKNIPMYQLYRKIRWLRITNLIR
jgi:signal peptidase I